MATIAIYRNNIFEKVQAETIEKCFTSLENFSPLAENDIRAEFAFNEDREYWFNIYFDEMGADICEMLKTINIRNTLPLSIDTDKLLFNLDINGTVYGVSPLIEQIKMYAINKIISRWFLYKGVKTESEQYLAYASNNASNIGSIANAHWNRKNRAEFYNTPYPQDNKIYQ